MELRDRVAIITGGGGGIGGATARHWMAEGARHVVVADYNAETAQAVADEIGCEGVGLDVTDEAAVADLVERTLDAHGPIDVFFSNAGA
ncbi:MAG: SDR family NAD(P)-dependent oxidoreductase, partial [Acidimicrobiales bacterium]|nr:SDR family NAD(P)-dependent oxidoreductase [Acidimicrobiales bacterium]